VSLESVGVAPHLNSFTYRQATPGKIPIASDAWTSTNQLSFLALTASWITEDWELVISLIDFILLKGVHSGANMAGMTYKTLEEFDMKHKVSYRLTAGGSSGHCNAHQVTIQYITNTGDNASNVGTFNHAVVDMLQENDARWELNADTSTIRCLSHIIHLAVLELLVGLKAVRKSDTHGNQLSDNAFLTEEMAELLGGDGQIEGEEDKDDHMILKEQQGVFEDEFDASPFAKVSDCVT